MASISYKQAEPIAMKWLTTLEECTQHFRERVAEEIRTRPDGKIDAGAITSVELYLTPILQDVVEQMVKWLIEDCPEEIRPHLIDGIISKRKPKIVQI